MMSTFADWLMANKDVLDALSSLSTFFGIVAAAFAGAFAFYRYRADVAHQKWLDAKALYESVLNDQLANPEFRGDCWQEMEKLPENKFRYSVFVNKMLWSLEGLLRVDSKDKEWFRSSIVIARSYKHYLHSPKFLVDEFGLYGPLLREAIQIGAGLDAKVHAGAGPGPGEPE